MRCHSDVILNPAWPFVSAPVRLLCFICAVVRHDMQNAYIVVAISGAWIHEATLPGPASQGYLFGSAVAVDGDGSNLYVGAMESRGNGYPSKMGEVYIYARSGAWGWINSGTTFIRPDTTVNGVNYDNINFGSSISIQGDVMAVGAYTFDGNGATFIFQRYEGPHTIMI